jgi:hypothetical protein
MWALTDTGGGYHLGALNFRLDHSLSFPSSILHFLLIAPPGLQLCQPFDGGPMYESLCHREFSHTRVMPGFYDKTKYSSYA